MKYNSEQNEKLLNEYKESFLASLEWDTRRTASKKISHSDVSVSITGSEGNKQICFTFRNNVARQIDHENIGRLAPAIKENMIVFMATKDGYVVAPTTKGKNIEYMKFSNRTKYESFVGDYDLKYDHLLGLYFVKKEEEKR